MGSFFSVSNIVSLVNSALTRLVKMQFFIEIRIFIFCEVHQMDAQIGKFCIQGGRLLMPSGELVKADLHVSDGYIESIGAASAGKVKVINASGCIVMPGAIDLHGDAFERQVMPRAGVSFPLEIALGDTDRQMIANGITTAFHGITYSWEPGLRSRETVIAIMSAIEEGHSGFGCDTKLHLRFETYNFDVVSEVIGWLEANKIDLLAFNNHMPSIQRKIESGQSLARFVERTGLQEHDFVDLVQRLADKEEEAQDSVKKLSACAREHLVPMASHDDETVETRKFYHSLGCKIAEFPLTKEALKEAHHLGSHIVLGAPNIIRGGSHMGDLGISAVDSIMEGFGDILCSDYYYPALIRSPFELVATGVLDLSSSWKMVSTNAAKAAGLDDRGEIAKGKRADLVLIELLDQRPIKLKASFVKGDVRYQSDWL